MSDPICGDCPDFDELAGPLNISDDRHSGLCDGRIRKRNDLACPPRLRELAALAEVEAAEAAAAGAAWAAGAARAAWAAWATEYKLQLRDLRKVLKGR